MKPTKQILFAPFEKVEELDDGTLKVFGIASSESRDSDGELIRADAVRAALPDYLRFGAVREMHQPIAAGTALEAQVDDAGVTHFGAHVVDDSSVKKVRAGVLKGFSLGGKITKRNADDKSIIEGLKLTEISLVDRPANPDSVISLVKFDSTGAVLGKIATRSDTTPKEGEDKYGDVEFADPKNKKYPIDTEAHIRAAWNYINKPTNAGKYSAKDAASIKRRIVAAWKKKIDKDGPPSASKDTEKADMATTLTKGMWDISRLASIIMDMHWLTQCAESEKAQEGDDSEVPDQLKAQTTALCMTLRDMVTEETAELLGLDEDDDAEELLESSAKAAKAILATSLQKAGRRFSKQSADAIGDLHKMALDMCDKFDKLGYKDADNPEDEDMADGTGKNAGASDDLKKAEELHKAEIASLTEKLTKAETEKAEAVTKSEQLEKQLKEMAEGTQQLIDQQLAKGALRIIPKESDTVGATGAGEPVKKAERPTDPQEEIRKAWQSPRPAFVVNAR